MNYHLFIVDEISLKYHLEYNFVGTGKSNTTFDIEIWKDIARLKHGDKIVFYVQNLKKFYGFFEVVFYPFFDPNHYLQPYTMPFLKIKKSNGQINEIKLQYRALIRPYFVFQNGIDEFELVDILPQSSTDVLWSILYRKLKGARGCSPLFENEFNIIFQKISQINNNQILSSQFFTFQNGQILPIRNGFQYNGLTNGLTTIQQNIKQDILNGNYRESHLHALLIPYLNQQPYIKWLGNEVYCGAGTQKMDILTIDSQNVFNIFEVKKDEISSGITLQIEKYINWLKHRFQCFNNNAYQPIVVGEMIRGFHKLRNRINEFQQFNNMQISLPILYIEYEINQQNNTIDFYQYNYLNNQRRLIWSI